MKSLKDIDKLAKDMANELTEDEQLYAAALVKTSILMRNILNLSTKQEIKVLLNLAAFAEGHDRILKETKES